jgi:hypothetical protein
MHNTLKQGSSVGFPILVRDFNGRSLRSIKDWCLLGERLTAVAVKNRLFGWHDGFSL